MIQFTKKVLSFAEKPEQWVPKVSEMANNQFMLNQSVAVQTMKMENHLDLEKLAAAEQSTTQHLTFVAINPEENVEMVRTPLSH